MIAAEPEAVANLIGTLVGRKDGVEHALDHFAPYNQS